MSNVPLPEPAFSLRWERGEHKVSPPMDDCDCYTADQMHAYAASVSAAKDAEISRLKHRIALHDPCNGRMAGEPPRYTPECVVLRAEVAGLRAALGAIDRECYSHVDGRDLFAQMHPRNMLDIRRRVDARETWFDGDWLTNLWAAIKAARTALEQKP